ncbi:MAG: PASTA domain-containing protein [Elusimicrobiota bacterium]
MDQQQQPQPQVHFSGGAKPQSGVSIVSVILVSFFMSALISVGTFVLCFLFLAPVITPKIKVPNLVGMTPDAAQMMMRREGLSVVVDSEEENGEVPKGQIAVQRPQASSELARGGTVSVVVSKGLEMVMIPKIEGMDSAVARQTLEGAGLVVSATEKAPSADIPEGKAVGTYPVADLKIKKGTPVKIIISEGPRKVTVPSLIKSTLDAASSKLMSSGLKIGEIRKTCDITKEFGIVIGQSPVAGKQVPAGSTVNLTINEEEKE